MFVKRYNNGNFASFDPFAELERVVTGAITRHSAPQPPPSFAPPVDVVELADALVVSCDLPGCKEEQIDVRLEDGVLTLVAERPEAATEGAAGVHHLAERRYGRFERTFKLPANVDGEKVSARYQDGVLWVTLPKREDAKPRKITIAKQ